jgi:DNA repair exonuclease SbcCD nuclease subunit
MTVRLMHLADLHLGAPLAYLGEKAAQRSKELETAFARALDSAAEKEVHAILIAGDLFNSHNPPPDLVSRTKAALANAAGAGIPVILIPGTHDSYRYAKCVFRSVEFPGVDVLVVPGRPIMKNLNGLDVFFHGFSGGRKKGGDAAAFARGPEEGIHVALVHGPVVEAGHWTPSPRDFPLTPDEIGASGFDYVALGHHHDFREIRRGDTTAVYPGTLEGIKFGEAGERYLVVAGVGEDGVAIEKTPHNQRTLSEIRIDLATSAVGSAEGLIAAIEKRSDPNAIVKALLTGAADFVPAIREIEPALAASFFHLEIVDETSVVGGELIQGLMREDTVRGMFVKKMLERIEKLDVEDRATAELALRLGVEQFIQAGER